MLMTRFNRPILRNSRLGWKFLNHKISVQAATKEFKEVEIKVPWGKLAGKLWGSPDIEPIIALHGVEDNASSYDPLVMYLPKDVPLLAVDLPGHGKSSWLPDGSIYSILMYLQSLHRLKEHLGLDKIGLIGHSLGGGLVFQYSAIFPESVKFVIALDTYKNPSLIEAQYFKIIQRDWNDFFKNEKVRKSSSSFTEEEIAKHLIERSEHSLDESSCKILMERGTTKNLDGTISLSGDPYAKIFMINHNLMPEHTKMLAKRIHCPYMVLTPDNGLVIEPKENYYDVMKVFEEYSKDFRFHKVLIAELMNPFITKHMYLDSVD